MTKITAVKVACISALALGLYGLSFAHGANEPSVVDPMGPRPHSGSPSLRAPGDSLVLDVSRAVAALDSVRVDERWEQVADWAVYGALLASPLSSVELRDAMYDKVPLRVPGIEAAANLDHGPGRRVIHKDGATWLFYGAHARRTATLARLADQVRMELGMIPDRFAVFSIESDLNSGAITVRREADVDGATLFSATYGYVLDTAHSVADVERWVGAADDLTHVRMLPNGVELGGRRHEGSRTTGITMEDLAALYQAHRILTTRGDDLERDSAGVEVAWSGIITSFNNAVDAYNRNNYALLFVDEIELKINALERRLKNQTASGQLFPGDIFGGLPSYTPQIGSSGIDRLRGRIEAIRPLAEVAMQKERSVQRQRFARENGWTPSPEPGFSLDPQEDSARLRNDFLLLRTRPEALVASARAIATRQAVDSTGARPRSADANIAIVVAESFRGGEAPGLRPLIAKYFAGSLGRLDFTDIRAMMQFSALMDYIERRSRFQCARYDGPLHGTNAGMILFYTDLMAKLWSIDYARSAPVDSVFGFLSAVEVGERGEREPVYWREADSLSNTRLWFGPKMDAYATSAEGLELNFAHMATRVYSAGSDPSKPGVESQAAELYARFLRWWDQHLAVVADYEQAYHAQNQIMKWSVVTGMLASEQRLPGLDTISVDHSRRFDRWYDANSALKFRGALRMVPRERWPGRSECMELFVSPPFRLAGRVGGLMGGVSLGGARTIEQGSRISQTFASGLRRGGVQYSSSTVDEVVTLRNVRYGLKEPTRAGVAESEIRLASADVSAPAQNMTFRTRAAHYHADVLSTTFEGAGSATRTVRLGVAGEDIASLSAQRGTGVVSLRLNDGLATLDRQVVDAFANAIAKHGSWQQALSAQPELLATRGGYAIENEAGVTIIIRDASGAGQARALHLVQGRVSPESRPWISSSGADHGSRVPMESLVDVSASKLNVDDAFGALNRAKWQRLTLREPGPGVGDDVLRVFTEQPPSGGTPIRVQTARTELGTLQGRVVDDVLYLERPANPALNQTFNDFVAHEGITSTQLGRIASDARNGVSSFNLAAPDVQRSAAAVLGDHIVAGDTRAMLRFLAKESAAGRMERSFDGLREYVAERGFSAYTAGRPSNAAEVFFAADRATATPNQLIYRAIGEVRRGDVAGAAVDIEAAFQRGSPTAEAVAALDKSLQQAGHGGLGGFGRLRSGGGGAEPPSGGAGPREIRLDADGFRRNLLFVLDEKRATTRPVDLATRRSRAGEIIDQDVIYVERNTIRDKQLLVERDPELAPGRYAAEVINDSRIEFAQFVDPALAMGLGLPKKIVHQGRTFYRVDTRAATTGARHVYLARARCDEEAQRRTEACRAA